jgi:hypothetical protein
MIPGIARVEVQVLGGSVSDIQIVPLRVVGEGSETAPPADNMERSTSDPQYFTGKLWLMESGSFQVRLDVNGEQGKAQIGVPVAAFAQRTLRMQKTTGAVLALLMILLVLSLIAILGTATRESQLEPGLAVPPEKRRRGRIVMTLTAAAILGILFLGNMWWTSVADANSRDMVYKPPPMQVSLSDGNHLTLTMGSSYWHEIRKSEQLDKIIPDHGHLMHLFLVQRQGFISSREIDLSCHGIGEARFADDVGKHCVMATRYGQQRCCEGLRPGFLGMQMVEIIHLRHAKGDDSHAAAPKVSTVRINATIVPLGADAHVEWILGGQALHAQKPTLLRFQVVDKNGAPATDLEPYMGMAGHLVILRSDLSVFAHVHPAGSVPMAALMLLQKEPAGSMSSMTGMRQESVPAEITFPYGFPQAGNYRLFLQVKRAGHVETAVFDTRVAH